MWFPLIGCLALVRSSGALRVGAVEQSVNLRFQPSGAKLNPLNYKCNPRRVDTVENLKDYTSLFDSGSGKSVFLGGDSLMMQVYHATKCAAYILGYPAEEEVVNNSVILTVKRYGAPDQTAFRLIMHVFFYIEELTGPNILSNKFVELFPEPHDLFAFNIAHYGYKGPELFTKELAKRFFEGFKKWEKDTGSHVVFFDHPPQHFNTASGNYWKQETGENDRNCSCSQPHLMQQDIEITNELATQIARESGVDYVALWNDMNPFCDEHPYDCTHFTLSPTIFTVFAKSLADRLPR